MAQPISFHTPPHDAHEAFAHELERAPEQHAEAILDVYNLLQVLHDRGILDAVTSAFKASDVVLAELVRVANTPQTIRALRNLVFLQQTFGSIEPATLQALVQAIPDGVALATAKRDRPIRIWTLLRRLLSRDSLCGLAAALDFVESLGRRLRALEMSTQPHSETSTFTQ